MNNDRDIHVDDELRELLVRAWNDMRENKVVQSSDVYQSQKYCGGYEGDIETINEGEFTFSKYDGNMVVMWISVPASKLDGIVKREIDRVRACDPD